MWGLKTTTVLMGGYGSPRYHQEGHGKLHINEIPGNIKIHELQKTNLLSTAHLLRRVLSIK